MKLNKSKYAELLQDEDQIKYNLESSASSYHCTHSIEIKLFCSDFFSSLKRLSAWIKEQFNIQRSMLLGSYWHRFRWVTFLKSVGRWEVKWAKSPQDSHWIRNTYRFDISDTWCNKSRWHDSGHCLCWHSFLTSLCHRIKWKENSFMWDYFVIFLVKNWHHSFFFVRYTIAEQHTEREINDIFFNELLFIIFYLKVELKM